MLYVMLMFALVFAQARTGGSTSGGDAGAGGMLGGLFCCMCRFIILALAYVPMIIGAWKVFDKAGEPGWASIVPIYNAMVIARIGGRPETDGLFTLIPIVGIYFAIVILIDM